MSSYYELEMNKHYKEEERRIINRLVVVLSRLELITHEYEFNWWRKLLYESK